MYILYKNPIQLETLAIVRYYNIQENRTFPEINHPSWATSLPSVEE